MDANFWKSTTNQGRLLAGLVIIKAIGLVVIGLGFSVWVLCADAAPCHLSTWLSVEGRSQTLTQALTTWDAQHYISLATTSYQPDHISNAFYPLLPAIMQLADAALPGGAVRAGLIVAQLLSLTAVLLFYRFTRALKGPRVALAASLLLLSFPTAFYLHLIYTEALFLTLVLGLFLTWYFPALYGRRQSWWGMGLTAFLLPLTRPQGLLVMAAAIYRGATQWWHEPERIDWKRSAVIVVCIGTGFISYLGLTWLFTGSPFAGFDAQRFFWSNNSIGGLLHPLDWLQRNFAALGNDGAAEGVLPRLWRDRLFFMLFVASLPLIWRRTDKTMFIYTLALGGVTALSGDLFSFPRYVFLLFPLFIAYGDLLVDRRWLLWAAVGSSFVFQAWLLILHTQNIWVA